MNEICLKPSNVVLLNSGCKLIFSLWIFIFNIYASIQSSSFSFFVAFKSCFNIKFRPEHLSNLQFFFSFYPTPLYCYLRARNPLTLLSSRERGEPKPIFLKPSKIKIKIFPPFKVNNQVNWIFQCWESVSIRYWCLMTV